jgi:hypothetical protein
MSKKYLQMIGMVVLTAIVSTTSASANCKKDCFTERGICQDKCVRVDYEKKNAPEGKLFDSCIEGCKTAHRGCSAACDAAAESKGEKNKLPKKLPKKGGFSEFSN